MKPSPSISAASTAARRGRRRAGSLAGFDAVLVRTMPPGSLEQVVFRMDLLHRLQARGVRVLNPPRAVEICVDKYLATALLEAAGLRVPPTVVCQHADAALEAFDGAGRRRGRQAAVRLRGPRHGARLRPGNGLAHLPHPGTHAGVLYLQQFIRHPGWDLRVFVVGGRVLTAMRRRSRGDWRTNVAQGGAGEAVRVGPEEERLALRAAAALGAPVAGVDLLPGPDGEWYVLEVNAVPGWRALAPVTGVDVAAAVVRFLTEEYRGG